MRLRAVLAGCGAMSKGWLDAVAATPEVNGRVEIVGLVDIDRAAAERRAAEQKLEGIVIGTNLAEALAEAKADVVFDVVPPAVRRATVETALAHGCHVLSEKPMATSLADAQALVREAARAGKLHAVVQNRRFHASVRRIRALLDSGALGKLNAIHCDFFVGAHFGGFRDAMQHVLLVDMAIHTLDSARYLAGEQPVAVYCHESNPRSSWYAHGSVANAIFEFSNDVVVTYRGSWSAEGQNTSWNANWRIVGAAGTLTWDGEDGIVARVVDGNEGFFRPLREIEVPPAADPKRTQGHASVLLDFVQAIDTGRQPETVGSDNIKSLGMVFAAVESAERRQRVEIAQ